MMLANPQMEQIDRDTLEALQLERLQKTVRWAYMKSSFYKNKFQKYGIFPDGLQSLNDIEKLPFTSVQELQQTSSMEFLTLPLSSVARISMWEHPQHITRMYTANDIASNIEMTSRVLMAAGLMRGSVVGLLGDMADSGLMDAQQALERLGATAVPLSTEYERTVKLMEVSHLDTLIGSSRRLLRLVIQLQADEKVIYDFPLKKILCLNESLQNPLKLHIENRTRTEVYNLFSSSEFGCIGMVFQCSSHIGQHFQEDFFYPEIIAFGTNETLSDMNRMGELVVTTLTAEAMPLIRFRTGQAVMRLDTPCSCGRTFLRIITPFGNIG